MVCVNGSHGALKKTRQESHQHQSGCREKTYLVHVSPNDIYTWAQGPQVGTHLIRAEVSLPSSSTKRKAIQDTRKNKWGASPVGATRVATPCEQPGCQSSRYHPDPPFSAPHSGSRHARQPLTHRTAPNHPPPPHNALPQNTPYTTRRGCGRPRGGTGTGRAGTAPGGAL